MWDSSVPCLFGVGYMDGKIGGNLWDRSIYNFMPDERKRSCLNPVWGVVSDDTIDALWEKVIRQFKKGLLKGAYVVTPNGNSRYYPGHWYTQGAKDAYEKGVRIRPLAGWNQYILKRESE